MNLYPKDYLVNRSLCSEQYHAQDFLTYELQKKSLATSNYLKLYFYSSLKKSIENNSVEEIKLHNDKMNQMGFHLKDLDPNSSLNDYVHGERYIPLLFFAIQQRSIASIKCLIDLGMPIIGQIHGLKMTTNQNSELILIGSEPNESKRLDIIDIINSLDDDLELKDAFQQHLRPIETVSNGSISIIEQDNDSSSEKSKKMQNEVVDLLLRFKQNDSAESKTCTLL